MKTDKKLFKDTILAYFLMVLGTILFVYLATEVLEKETLFMDDKILLYINSFSNKTLDAIMIFITNIAGVVFTISFTIFLVVYYLIKKNKVDASFVGISILGTVILNTILKLIFKRVRPNLWDLLVTEKSYSFPSGHTMLSMAVALVLIFLFWNTKYRKIVTPLALIFAFLVALSRLYLGVHYPTDVLGGWLISFVWIVLSHRLIYNEENDKVDIFKI